MACRSIQLKSFQLDNMNMQKWRFALMVVNTDSAFNGGYFKVRASQPISPAHPTNPSDKSPHHRPR